MYAVVGHVKDSHPALFCVWPQHDRHQSTSLDTLSKLRVPRLCMIPTCPTGYQQYDTPRDLLYLCANAPQQAALHVVEDRVVFDDGQVLCLTLELLVRVHARAKHLRLLRPYLTHLL